MRRFWTAATVFGLSAMLVGGTIGCAGKKPPAVDPAAQAARDAAEKERLRLAAEAEAAKKAAEEAAKKAAEEAAKKVEAEAAAMMADVHFEYDKYSLTSLGKSVMAANAQSVSKSSKAVRIEGHCDERGSDEYNLALGERRAETVRKYLVDYGVSASRLRTVSFGEEQPVDPGHDESAWSKNRRAHLVAE